MTGQVVVQNGLPYLARQIRVGKKGKAATGGSGLNSVKL
jgi:hypothetical protein